jgi:hypothetical protein
MALATLSDALPTPELTPGLAARMSSLRAQLASLLADLDPGLLMGRDALSLYGDFCHLERLVTGAKTLLAPRIAESGLWESGGHRSAAALLADVEGGTTGQARRTLEAGRRLVDLPGTEAAVRQGSLSGPKLDQITEAASLDPSVESELLAGSASEPLHVVKERCQRARTTAVRHDQAAALARIHARRSFQSWTDGDGAFCFSGRDTPERGAKLLARLVPVANRLRHDRRAAAAGVHSSRSPRTPSPVPVPESVPETEAALRADAFFLLVTGTRPMPPATHGATPSPPVRVTSGTVSTGPIVSTGPTTDQTIPDPTPDTTLADPATLGSADDLVTAPPPATIIVRVDLAALRRGTVMSGELCELDGHGPVPVDVVRSLVDDAYLACVFTESGDIRAVSHLGRTINAHLRTALAFRDVGCVVPGCGVGYSLEIDHVHPLEHGGATELDNLALLCSHHHRMKTYEGWTLERTGPSDADPGWTFTPQPPFGQEPDLGADIGKRLPEPVPRK